MKNTTIFCGCSYVEGVGLNLEKQDPDLWVNIVHKIMPVLSNTRLVNYGKGGATNEDVFMCAMHHLLHDESCAFLFVSWTSLKRLYVYPGLETYNTKLYLERMPVPDIKINPNTIIPGTYIEDIRDRFFDLTHAHYDILKILRYTTVIRTLANRLNVQVFFVNSLLPVDIGYFDQIKKPNRLPGDTTTYTQQLLNLDTRSDEEYFKIYDKIHQEYSDSGGLNGNWLNLDQGFRSCFYLDQGNDNLHPGINSNQTFANYIIQKLQQIQQIN